MVQIQRKMETDLGTTPSPEPKTQIPGAFVRRAIKESDVDQVLSCPHPSALSEIIFLVS